MNTKPVLPRSHIGTTIVAAALSFLIAIGLLTAVAGLFLDEGTPLQNVVIAERACSEFTFISEREACVRSFLAASYHRRLASR
jgi:hypothetical protein